MRPDLIENPGTDTIPLLLAQSKLENTGSQIIGIIVGFGLVLAILSIMVIAGKMIIGNFSRHPRWASRGVDDLPWVLLAVCLMLAAVTIVTVLLTGSNNDGVRDWDQLIDDIDDGSGGSDDDDDDDEEEEDEEEDEEEEEEDESDEESDDDPPAVDLPEDPGERAPEDLL